MALGIVKPIEQRAEHLQIHFGVVNQQYATGHFQHSFS